MKKAFGGYRLIKLMVVDIAIVRATFGGKNRKAEYFLNDERLKDVDMQRDLNVLVHQS